MEGVTS